MGIIFLNVFDDFRKQRIRIEHLFGVLTQNPALTITWDDFQYLQDFSKANGSGLADAMAVYGKFSIQSVLVELNLFIEKTKQAMASVGRAA